MKHKNILEIRENFPIFKKGNLLDESIIYFDNAASSQTPQPVIDAIVAHYQNNRANVYRGLHGPSQRATATYDGVREQVAKFIGAQSSSEIVFNSGTTAGLNQLAFGLVKPLLDEGDIIYTTVLEHHSNYLPWQAIVGAKGAQLKHLPLTKNYQVDLENLPVDKKGKALVIQHTSNVLGVSQPLKELVEWAHNHKMIVIVDGAQSLQHSVVNVSDLGIDAFCFSSHKMYGPTGVGVLYLNKKWHKLIEPVYFGGEMVHLVGEKTSTFKEMPYLLEAGTPPIAQVIGLGAAIRWIEEIGYNFIQSHEKQLYQAFYEELKSIEGIDIYSPKNSKGILSFNIQGVHPHDVATAYNQYNIALRAGHHCAQPLMREINQQATLRASLAIYNTLQEVDYFIKVTKEIKEFFYGFK